jgi:hypothetical protein
LVSQPAHTGQEEHPPSARRHQGEHTRAAILPREHIRQEMTPLNMSTNIELKQKTAHPFLFIIIAIYSIFYDLDIVY